MCGEGDGGGTCIHRSVGEKLRKVFFVAKADCLADMTLLARWGITLEIDDKLVELLLFAERNFFVIKITYQTLQNLIQQFF